MKRKIMIGYILLAMFLLWTVAVCGVDVQPIGPEGSCVGFASINGYIHDLTGVNFGLYDLTDWLSLIPLAVVMGLGILGLSQWIGRRSLWKVDRNILALGVFYAIVGAVFLLFEMVVINFRPVLIDGVLEASYPSSTTMLVLCVMGSAMVQLRHRISNIPLRWGILFVMGAFSVFMVIGRVLSGVHWMTDIVGGCFLSGGLVLLYDGFEISVCNT